MNKLDTRSRSITFGKSAWRPAGGVLLASCLAFGAAAAEHPVDFSHMSIEELADIEISSVSKRKESLSDAAAAIFVITQEDIRRSGYTSIPEVLRLAPNLQVARVDSSQDAIDRIGAPQRGSWATNDLDAVEILQQIVLHVPDHA